MTKYRWPRILFEVLPCGCWLGLGTDNGRGYVRITIDGVRRYFHQWMYEQLVGPVPEGLELDHLCRNRACGNPAHLEPVTHAENTRRAVFSPHGVTAANAAKTHCVHGHEFTEENTWRRRNGQRQCRTCNRERAAARYVSRLKAAK